ncbi:MAG: hypothetical protein P8008_03805 [Gammaproteobacteria bacterium]
MSPDTYRVFDVYHHPRSGYQTVRRGFSWLAFWLPSVWAVRRGLGYVTLVLLVATTAMFDVAKFAGQWLSHPVADIEFVCTVAATSRRQAIRAAAQNDFGHGSFLLTGA